jgi:hypothetical protein
MKAISPFFENKNQSWKIEHVVLNMFTLIRKPFARKQQHSV